MSTESIELRDVRALGRLERRRVSAELVVAARRTPGLERKFPAEAEAHLTAKSSRNYLNRLRKHHSESHLWGAVIKSLGYGASGMVQVAHNPGVPDYVQTQNQEPVQLSYWFESIGLRREEQIARGEYVVRDAIESVRQSPLNGDIMWTLTHQEDGYKVAVCSRTGFIAIAGPEVYDIGDGVQDKRQLWARIDPDPLTEGPTA